MVRAALLAVLVVVGGCSSGSSSSPSPPSPPPASADAAAPAGPGKWDCVTDGDCINSCAHGAVNRVWYDTTKPAECEDGCANQLAEAPRCIDRGCVAFHSDPQDSSKITRSEHCTRKK